MRKSLMVLVCAAQCAAGALAGAELPKPGAPATPPAAAHAGGAAMGGQAPKTSGVGGVAAAVVMVKVDVKDVRYIHTKTPPPPPNPLNGLSALLSTPEAYTKTTTIKLSATAAALPAGTAMTPAQFTFSVDGEEVGTVDSPDGKSAEVSFQLHNSYVGEYVIRVVWKSKGNPPLPSGQGTGKLKYAG